MVGVRMRRGQAFETMMLVISVIVAVAILGILLGFIGGIGTFGANAKTVMPDLVKKVSQRGYGLEIRDKVEFSEGDRLYKLDAIGQAAIHDTEIQFECAEPAFCEGDGALTVSENSIVVNQKVTAVIAVCGNPDVSPTYRVVIGSKLSGTSDYAEETACELA